jgi:hypothetical protein
MQYVLFVFSSRTGAMAAYDYCVTHRIGVAVLNTPRELAASCGISLKVSTAEYGYVQRYVAKLPAYVGTYLVNASLSRRTFTRLYN